MSLTLYDAVSVDFEHTSIPIEKQHVEVALLLDKVPAMLSGSQVKGPGAFSSRKWRWGLRFF